MSLEDGWFRVGLSSDEFTACLETVSRVVDVRKRLPEIPFVPAQGYVAVGEWMLDLGSHYLPVLDCLMSEFGDRDLRCVVVAPDPAEHAREWGYWPGFWLGKDSLAEHYV